MSKIEKLTYYEKVVDSISGEDKKLGNILFILVQNCLFGEQGLSVHEIHNMDAIDIGESKIRSLLNSLEEKELIIKDRDGKKFIYTANLDKLKYK